MKTDSQRFRIKLLLQIIDEAFDRKAWHGPNLRGSLRGVTAREAAWRPARGRHNIWEIAVHAAYWKYAVRRRILGGKRGSFPLKGCNWFARPTRLDGKTWREDVNLLTDEHARMRDAIARLSDAALSKRTGKGKTCLATLVYGVALHDVYHAGQIQLLKRLQR